MCVESRFSSEMITVETQNPKYAEIDRWLIKKRGEKKFIVHPASCIDNF